MSKLIMVIEDTQDIREIFETLLTEEGYRVSMHSSPRITLELVKTVHPDLTIIDLLFGNEPTGLQLVQQMQRDPVTSSIPIIACSAQIQLLREFESQTQGRNIRILMKPFDIDDLLKAVHEALGIHDAN